jgi:PAS domain S-box-containing protein
MNRNIKIGKSSLIAISYVIVTIAILILGFFYYTRQKALIKERVNKELISIAELKAFEIVNWVDERKADAIVLSQSPGTIISFRNYIKKGTQYDYNLIHEKVDVFKKYYKYEDIFIIDKLGKVLVSTNDTMKDVSDQVKNILPQKPEESKVTISDLYFCKRCNRIHFDFISPIIFKFNGSNKILGYAILRINPYDYLYPIVQRWPSISRTAETLIVRGEGDSVLFLNPLRHKVQAVLTIKLPLSRTDIPAVRAVRGRTGIYEGNDYRNVQVVSYSLGFRELPWKMVSKVDASEIYDPLRFRTWVLGIFLILLLTLLGFVVLHIRAMDLKQYYKNLFEKEEQLNRAEQKFKLFLEHSPVSIAAFDANMKFITTSKRFLADYKLTESDVINKIIYEVFPEIPQRWRDIHNRCLKGAVEKSDKDIFKRIDGNEEWVRWEMRPWFEKSGEIGGLLLFNEKITDQIKAAEELYNSQLNFLTTFESNPAALVITRLNNGEILKINKAYTRIIGYKPDEIIGFGGFDKEMFIFPNDRKVFVEYLKRDGVIRDMEIILRVKSGEVRNMVLYMEIIQYDNEQCILSALLDVTEKKQKEQEIKKLNEDLEKRISERTRELLDLYNNSPSGYHSLNSDGLFELINDTELKWLGYTREEIVNKIHVQDLLTEKSIEMYRKNYPLFKKNGKIEDLELDFIRKDGTIMPALVNATAIYDSNGNYVRSRSTIIDHTERKKAEESLKLAKEELEATNKELEAFSYSVSHDLRAPLRALDGFAKILVEDYSPVLDDEGKRLFGIIMESSRKMGTLIDDLLAFSRLGKAEMFRTPVDMYALAKEAFIENTSKEQQEKINFIIDLLPSVNGDLPMLRQVWMNLVSNAVKFSSKRENPEIKISSIIDNDFVVYSIQDNGTGFDMKYVSKLFGVFQRLHSFKDYPGTGVGLAIVKRIVERHGGTVWPQSELNMGATFYFNMPVEN